MKPDELVYQSHYSPLSRADLIKKVQQSMSEKRFKHVLGVEATALKLAELYNVDLELASIAALTHDYAKERPEQDFRQLIVSHDYPLELLEFGNEIWHGVVGAEIVAKELGITEPQILTAIRKHTTGASEMSLLDKVIYVADYIEPGRDFPVVEEARKIAFTNLDQAVAFETKHTLLHLINTQRKIYPRTLETYNSWVVAK